jgi:DNA replication protein DnaC
MVDKSFTILAGRQLLRVVNFRLSLTPLSGQFSISTIKLSKALKQYAKYEALIIDDIGYVQQSREEMEVLFTLFADRYERGSVMVTSNLPFSKWEQIFKDPMTTAAAIDRLVHHSIILELNLLSYRLEQSRKTNMAGSETNISEREK